MEPSDGECSEDEDKPWAGGGRGPGFSLEVMDRPLQRGCKREGKAKKNKQEAEGHARQLARPQARTVKRTTHLDRIVRASGRLALLTPTLALGDSGRRSELALVLRSSGGVPRAAGVEDEDVEDAEGKGSCCCCCWLLVGDGGKAGCRALLLLLDGI